MGRLICVLPLIGLLAVSEWSCHRRQVRLPAPAAPAAPTVSAPAQAPAPESPPSAPEQAVPAQPPPSQPAPAQPAPEQPVQPAPSQPAPNAVPSPARPRPRPPTQPPASASPAPAPQLGPVLTPERQKEYNGAIDQSLEHAQSSLRAIGNRQLTAEQRASVQEIQNFIRQAQTARTSDLPGARRLAERAEVLGRNLERSVH